MPFSATRWTQFREAFAHAFAVRRDPLTDEQLATIRLLASEVKRRRLEPIVAAAAELARPVTGLTSHSLSFIEPILTAVVPADRVEMARGLLAHPDAVDAFQSCLDGNADTPIRASDSPRDTDPSPRSSEVTP